MANAENLKKGKATQFKSGKDAVENGRKAGVASGASRRRKRAMRQAAAMLLNTQIPMNERGPFMGTVKTLLKTFGYTRPRHQHCWKRFKPPLTRSKMQERAWGWPLLAMWFRW